MKAIILSLCFFAVGVGMLWSGIDDLRMANRAWSWPTTEGSITFSECKHYWVMSESSSYFTHVNYTYSVEGRSYKGDRVAFGYNGSWWRKPNQNIADRLSSAKTVLVRYDPDKPSTAVLSYGLNGSTVMTLFAGSWILLVTAVCVLHTRRPRSRTSTLSLSYGPKRFTIITQGVGGIVLLGGIGLVIACVGALLIDWGILSTLATT